MSTQLAAWLNLLILFAGFIGILVIPFVAFNFLKELFKYNKIQKRIDHLLEISLHFDEEEKPSLTAEIVKALSDIKVKKLIFYGTRFVIPFLIIVSSVVFAWGFITMLTILIFYGLFILLYILISNYIRARRTKQIIEQLPNAIDLMSRAVTTGRSVPEAIGIVAEDFSGKIGDEFRTIQENLKLGKSLIEALNERADALEISEFRYFTIVLIMQSQTGGNIVELLNNLTDTLRLRQGTKMKIKALAAEPLASAVMLSILPFVVISLVTLLNPKYMSPLFYDRIGQFILGICLISQILGTLVIRKMTRLDV